MRASAPRAGLACHEQNANMARPRRSRTADPKEKSLPNPARWLAGLLLSGVAMAAQAQQAPGYRIPPALDDNWRVTSAETLGLDPKRLASLTAMVRAAPRPNVHVLLIERGRRLVYEEYFDGSDERWGHPLGHVVMTRDTLHDLRSVSKSVVSALVGIALAEGAISSVDRPVLEWFPELSELDTPERRRITLAHVLGMAAGLQWNEAMPYTDPPSDEIGMPRDPRPLHLCCRAHSSQSQVNASTTTVD